MERFLERHRDHVTGVLSGFDRVLFRGTLRSLSYLNGLEAFLATYRILYKNFACGYRRRSRSTAAGWPNNRAVPFVTWNRPQFPKRPSLARFEIKMASPTA